ncbi:succinate--hydroxymethylglutarate -transferase isoform X1 [Labeo rohita]|uniref:Succinate--hydroxymethylglutarate-transferase isoform X1 n=1 Tax=Labeo rohita TaxID=84645 RepID=A0A498LWT7_LABRO|nr:succinate--hydroxymethylglutarate -transferase isoform X1 [Labeo rohita]
MTDYIEPRTLVGPMPDFEWHSESHEPNRTTVVHNGLILEMDHPTSGRITVPGPAVRFSSFECSNPMPPPVIGQHTVQVLRDTLGYSDDAINQLLASQTVTQNKVQ